MEQTTRNTLADLTFLAQCLRWPDKWPSFSFLMSAVCLAGYPVAFLVSGVCLAGSSPFACSENDKQSMEIGDPKCMYEAARCSTGFLKIGCRNFDSHN